LIDEFKDSRKGIPFDDKARAAIKELTDTLRGNLDKVVQHGKRADGIVKNMLLHSREGSGARALISTTRFSITRALLNLISNGFYAATKRKAETNGGDYVPTIGASIKSLGDRVEIKIRDNGTGIPPEVKDKMFNPFFTTKPTGEGTGLGLSISHHIIVKQHGSAIEVDTQPGAFTEIRVILPRVAVFLTESGR